MILTRTMLGTYLAALAFFSSFSALAQDLSADFDDLRGNIIYKGKDVNPSERVSETTVLITSEKKPGIKSPYSIPFQVCTGTLISSDVVITAGHCVSEFIKYRQYVDLRISYRANGSTYLNIVPMKKVAVHPNYRDSEDKPYDVALIQLANPIKDRKPMKLGSEESFRDGVLVTALGFGKNDRPDFDFTKDPKLMALRTKIDALDVKKTTPKERAALADALLKRIDELQYKMFLLLQIPIRAEKTYYQGGTMLKLLGPSICSGDSGGPSYVQVGKELQLIGVHSAGTNAKCVAPKRTSIWSSSSDDNMSVDVYIPVVSDWIIQTRDKWKSQKDI